MSEAWIWIDQLNEAWAAITKTNIPSSVLPLSGHSLPALHFLHTKNQRATLPKLIKPNRIVMANIILPIPDPQNWGFFN